MAQDYNDSIKLNAPRPLNAWEGIVENNVFRPYYTIAEANATIPFSYRHDGLKILVKPQGSIEEAVEHRYGASRSNTSLVRADKVLDDKIKAVEQLQATYTQPPVYTQYTAYAETDTGANASFQKTTTNPDGTSLVRTWYSQVYLTNPPLDFSEFKVWAPLVKGTGTGATAADPGYFPY